MNRRLTNGLFTYCQPISFIIRSTEREEEIKWNDIESVFAYNQDSISFDDVYIDLIVNGEIISVSDDTDGFDTFIENLNQRLRGIKDYWIVVKPAFAMNFKMSFDRFGRSQEQVEKIYYQSR